MYNMAMKNFIFVAFLFFSLASACCLGPQYRPPIVPTAQPVVNKTVQPTRSMIIDVLPDAAHGKIPTAAVEVKPFSITAVRINMPVTVNRGDNIFIGVYPPTGADVEEVTVVIGIANYLTLNKQRDTSFTGYFRVPDLFDPGQYTVSFFFRTKDNKRRVLQRLLTVQ